MEQSSRSALPRPSPNPNWIADWLEVNRKADELLMAELREKIGPGGDLKAAYCAWYKEQMREHDKGLILMLKNSGKAEAVEHEED